MKIAIIGAGAMGSIYGAHLSKNNEVFMIDTNEPVVSKINEVGLEIMKEEKSEIFYPKAFTSSEQVPVVDIVILFVKALYSRSALESNKNIIGENTILMTLQNGQGHEDLLKEFTAEQNVVIGTTEDNGKVMDLGVVSHGGTGNTNIGSLDDTDVAIDIVKAGFENTCFNVIVHENIQQLIWDKLFINSSLSALTGVLQVPMGFIASNEHTFDIAKQLIKESVAVAKAQGLVADYDEIVEKVKKTSLQSPEGVTSICADIRNGRLTEVDTISGAVVKSAKKYNVAAPTHELVVKLIHALEKR